MGGCRDLEMSGNPAASGSEAPLRHHPTFGDKRIGYLAGCALLVNTITGPGVPQLSNMFAESGWLMPSICIVAIWLVSTVSASMFCEAMRMVPGNEHFRGRAEYTTIVKHYLGHKWYVASQTALNAALQSLNIISIIQSSQVMDNAFSAVFRKTCALNLTPFANVWTDPAGVAMTVAGSTSFISCVDSNDWGHGSAWGCHFVVSAGFLLTMAVALPCGRWNLEENMSMQMCAFVLTAVCWATWFLASAWYMEPSGRGLPAINNDPQTGSQAAVLGTILFNFGYLTTVPSWINERAPSVSVNRSLWSATTTCVLVYFCVGLAGAFAFSEVLQGLATGTCQRRDQDPSFNCANDLLQVFASDTLMGAGVHTGPIGNFILRCSTFLFPIVAVVTSIPVFSIVLRYNMLENGFSKFSSLLCGVVAPWVLACPLIYMPSVLSRIINYTSLVFVSFVDFVVPLLIYIKLQQQVRSGQQKAVQEGNATAAVPSENEEASDRGADDAAAKRAPTEEVSDRGTADGDGDLPSVGGSASAGSFEGVHVHNAFWPALGLSPSCKSALAGVFASLLVVMAVSAAVLTIKDGSYTLNSETCALVGS